MIRYIQKMVAAYEAKNHLETFQFATKVAREFSDSPIGDYAQSLAAQELRKVLRADARTHIGRIGNRAR